MPTATARRISSNLIEDRRRAFPYLWFGGLGAFAIRMSYKMAWEELIPLLAVTGFVAVAGYGIVFLFNRNKVDVVWDDGKELIVEKGSAVAHVPISDILKIKHSRLIAPRRATLVLSNPCIWGDRIVFTLPFSFIAGIRECAEIRDLAARVKAAHGAVST